MREIRYSPEPPSAYAGKVDQKILNDIQRWNWRWMCKGDEDNKPYDYALMETFNDAQREAMTMPPLDALNWYQTIFGNHEAMAARMNDAHIRLYTLVLSREGNLLVGNFKRNV